jgi:hypothetical protein
MYTEEELQWHYKTFNLAREIIDNASEDIDATELEYINGEMFCGEDLSALLSVIEELIINEESHWKDLVPRLVEYTNMLKIDSDINEMQTALDRLFEAKGEKR